MSPTSELRDPRSSSTGTAHENTHSSCSSACATFCETNLRSEIPPHVPMKCIFTNSNSASKSTLMMTKSAVACASAGGASQVELTPSLKADQALLSRVVAEHHDSL